jgi:ComF family protein
VCLYEGTAKNCIHLLKYNSRLKLAAPLGKLMFDFVNKNMDYEDFDMIVPVPLHSSRLRERGFNQAEVLSRKLSGYTKHPVCTNVLKRTKPTLSQTGLSKTKRFTNLQGAFKITKDAFVSGKKVLLVDDVFTTGSTVNEAAKALLKAGAESVDALVLARGI